MTQLKSATLRIAFYVIGFCVGVVLWLVAGVILGSLGFWPSAALYNAYFLVIGTWIVVMVATTVLTRDWAPRPRWSLMIFLTGTVTFSLMGGLQVLFTTPQYLIFWPR